MELILKISNADERLLKAIKSVVKLEPQAKIQVRKGNNTKSAFPKIDKSSPGKQLKNAITEAENGKVDIFSSYNEAIDFLDANH
ncbi:hypothetical protein BKH46_04010 [Helicobacter sp. 12S02634-8]|uniref:hypothetical protein n=1 Tax=Helicobacter sp. 12S02634-8 TaxID=1476199 RepID=UPI000BA6350C|nr:hypothetical protein [Helicobacter sp. 12S02634-8]PAF47255.1 hypothetical protein BKH46_04010 [Helicobacter sp. 12S02634-8]